MTVTTLASGSSGNCILVCGGQTRLLVDAGISCRRIQQALAGLGLSAHDLTGVLITHEHADHIAGLATLFKRTHLPVWCSHGTGRQLEYRIAFLGEVLHTFAPGESFPLGELTVGSFPTLHDAAQSVGYTFSHGTRKAAVVTDLGTLTPDVLEGIRGAGLLVAEANYDPEMLENGSYPCFLKQRIRGERGHLSNADCARLCARSGADTVVLAHLSAENNTPRLALETVRARLDGSVTVEAAPRAVPGRTYEVLPCKPSSCSAWAG